MQRLLSVIRVIERACLVTLLLAMSGLFAFNVVMRLVGGSYATSFGWIDEVVRLMNIFLVFLAAGIALERGKQVSVDSWRDRIAAGTGLPLRRIIDAVGVVFSLFMAFVSGQMAAFVHSTGQVSPTVGLPMAWLYAAPCLGFLLLALRYAASFAGLFDRFAAQAEGGE